MQAINTERLKLIPLSLESLVQIRQGQQCVVEGLEHIRLLEPVTHAVVLRAIDVKISMMEVENVSEHPWLTFWLVTIPDEGISAGMIGFKGLPHETGEVEIGYGIDQSFRGRGYATEAAKALIGWAFKHPRCSVIVADTNKDNLASVRVLEKLGMKVHSETDDKMVMKLRL